MPHNDSFVAYMQTHLPAAFNVTVSSEKNGVTTYAVGCFTVEQVVQGVSRKFNIMFGGVVVRRDLYRVGEVLAYIVKHSSPSNEVIPNLRIAAKGGLVKLKPLIAVTPYARVDVGIALTTAKSSELSMLFSDTPSLDAIFVPDSVYAPTGRWVHSVQFRPFPSRRAPVGSLAYTT